MQAVSRSGTTAAESGNTQRLPRLGVVRLASFKDGHLPSPGLASALAADRQEAMPSGAAQARASVEVVDFEQAHIRLIRPQSAQQEETEIQQEAPEGQAWTALVDGRPIACAGFVLVWEGRAYAWALIDKDAGPYMLQITRVIRKHLAASGFRRVEMAVDRSFADGRRWAQMLGFECEGLARAYLPNGHDAWIYARIT